MAINRRQFIKTSMIGSIYAGLIGCGGSNNVANLNSETKEGKKYLFFDNTIIAEMMGVSIVWNQANKYSSPVLVPDKPWEYYDAEKQRGIVNVYGSVFFDTTYNKYLMYYQIYPNMTRNPAVCLAMSDDLINWEKSSLSKYIHNDSNVVIVNSGKYLAREAISPSVLKLNNQYLCMYFDQSVDDNYNSSSYFAGGCISLSGDGINWFDFRQNPVLFASDIINVMHDHERNKFFAYFKWWQILAYSQNGALIDLEYQYLISFDLPIKIDSYTYKVNGAWVDINSQFIVFKEIIINNCANIVTRRIISMASSNDFINWGEYQPIIVPDDKDEIGTQFYGMSVFKDGTFYIGLLRVMNNIGEIDVEIAFSCDGRLWNRSRTLFINRDAKSWDSSMIFTANEPVIKEDCLFFYYGGFNKDHSAETEFTASIGLAKLRKDGYVSIGAENGLGYLNTKPIIVKSDSLLLNINSVQGSCSVEVSYPDGSVVPGFSNNECDQIVGSDSVKSLVTWNSYGLADLIGKEVVITFYLNNASIYSLTL